MFKKIALKMSVVAFALLGSVAQAQWFNPCDAFYNGTWYFRGGRPMSISVLPAGGGNVRVTISQQNGSETLWGSCQRRPNGSGRISFSGGVNNGRLSVNSNGYAQGNVAGIAFEGWAN